MMMIREHCSTEFLFFFSFFRCLLLNVMFHKNDNGGEKKELEEIHEELCQPLFLTAPDASLSICTTAKSRRSCHMWLMTACYCTHSVRLGLLKNRKSLRSAKVRLMDTCVTHLYRWHTACDKE